MTDGHTILSIATAIGADVVGDAGIVISGVAEPAVAGPSDLALAMSEAYAADLGKGAARAAVLGPGMDWKGLGLDAAIVVSRPRYALAGVTQALDLGPAIPLGVHPSSVIAHSAKIADGSHIAPFVSIGPDVHIGRNARIGPHVSIGEGARIGDDALLLAGVRIGARVVIGNRVIIQPGAVVGGDGFSFVTPEKSHVETARESLGTAELPHASDQSWTRIHSLGGVRIGDDVEIGANTAIDRGTIADTVIGDGTKIDNLVHVGHNCRIGRDCLLCGQVGFAGSAVVGDRVVLGGQCGVSDNIEIGSDVVAAGATKIYSNVPPGRMIMGSPAVKLDTHVEMYKALRRLPRLARTVAALQKAVSNSDRSP